MSESDIQSAGNVPEAPRAFSCGCHGGGDKTTRRAMLKAAGCMGLGAAAGVGIFSVIRRRRRGPNIVFIISDAMRADRLGKKGPSGGSLTPFLDSVATRGTVFTNFISPSSWTLPSVAAMMSSRNPIITGEYYSESYAAGATTFARELEKAGYLTLAAVRNPWLPARMPDGKFMPTVVTDGFGQYRLGPVKIEDNPLFEKGIGGPKEVTAFAPAETVTDEALGVLAASRAGGDRGPFLMYLHYMNTHQPYSPSPRYLSMADAVAPAVDGFPDHLIYQVMSARGKARGWPVPLPGEDLPLLRRAEALYDASVASVDAAVERLAEGLSQRGELENTVFLFTSDHGEEFGERGRCGHSVTLYQECIHVPFVAWGPGVPSGRSGRLLRGIDVAPEICRLAGVEVPTDFEGEGFGLGGTDGGWEAVSCVVGPPLPRKLQTVTMSLLEPGGRKYILKRPATGAQGEASTERFDLGSDPGEQSSVWHHKEEIAALYARLDRYWSVAARRPMAARLALDKESEDVLRSLGYL